MTYRGQPLIEILVRTHESQRYLEAYLPDNYFVAYQTPDGYLVKGSDHAGWTARDYVIPRLGSGGMGAQIVFDAGQDKTSGERHGGF